MCCSGRLETGALSWEEVYSLQAGTQHCRFRQNSTVVNSSGYRPHWENDAYKPLLDMTMVRIRTFFFFIVYELIMQGSSSLILFNLHLHSDLSDDLRMTLCLEGNHWLTFKTQRGGSGTENETLALISVGVVDRSFVFCAKGCEACLAATEVK